MGRFREQAVIVTGGGRGIGRATALRFASEGASVVVADVNAVGAEEVAHRVRTSGAPAMAVRCDVQDASSVKALVEAALSRFGRINILVCNAGVTRDKRFSEMTVDDWDEVMRVNSRGAFLCAKAVALHMMSRRSGKIVFVSSASARGKRDQANYATAKAGLHGLTRTLALELGPFQINVNCVAPGHVDTAMSRAVAERLNVPIEEFLREAAERIPLGRVGQPEDIAAVIAFLCSADASYLSGEVIYVNGGRQS